MKYTTEKLADLQEELRGILKELQAQKLTASQAADKIAHVKEEIDTILKHLAQIRRGTLD
jgi:hypothetical protein